MSTDDDKQKVSEEGYGTTGHSWDGIEEWNNPMPKWWVWTFYATVAWGLLYTIAYPAWPLINGATPGLLGQSTRADVAADIATVNERNSGLNEALAGIELATLTDNADLHGYAVNKGASVFLNNCSQCHGAGAAGVQASGYPNLLDDDWLWGGAIDEIAYTVRNGIRNEQSFDSHYSEMPAYGEFMEKEEIAGLVEYVRSLSGLEYDAALAEAAGEAFADNCAACHGDAGMGDRSQGAPNLTDAIWLYGGDRASLTETITNARFGVMPPWGPPRMTEAQVQAVATYVHQLGGGETEE